MMNPKNPPVRDPDWLKKVKSMCCVITGYPESDPAHIRYGLGGGMGMKPGDDCVIPIRHDLHVIQHNVGEITFWAKYISANPDFMMKCLKAYARELYKEHKE